ncbi:hypothetical protein JHK87_006120 [Glycine soja]|nr:hypothetical protein JHK87_006120 [Glycine soja]
METVVIVRNVLGRWGKKAAEATKKAESLAGNAWQHYNFSERVELQEFSQGSCPPLALQGMLWSTIGDQRFLQLGFDWDTNEMSILLLAKLAKPLIGTARIVINSLHIKGDLLASPILDGKALLYSFISTPEVRIGVAFGSNGSQSLPATEWPGISSWLLVPGGAGELKKMLTEPTGLHVQDRKLIYKKKERDSKSYLDVERVKDGSKLVLLVDIESRKRRLLEMLKIAKKEKTLKSLTEIKVEVDKLAKKDGKGMTIVGGCRYRRAIPVGLRGLLDIDADYGIRKAFLPQREKCKAINGDDLLWAMTTLGFEDYVELLKGYL